jgi:SAM-dependent methyltransferase
MWDARYNTEEYVYGTAPNDFLKENYQQIPKGKVLCLAEGEGRNAVFLAKQGYEVTAVDSSEVGLNKAQKLADENGVNITTVHADLAKYELGTEKWDGIVSIFCHLPKKIHEDLHMRVVNALKHQGIFLLEAYRPEQLELGTGGPPVKAMMMTEDDLTDELDGLHFLLIQEIEREVHEGSLHNGLGAVVQLIARRD